MTEALDFTEHVNTVKHQYSAELRNLKEKLPEHVIIRAGAKHSDALGKVAFQGPFHFAITAVWLSTVPMDNFSYLKTEYECMMDTLI